MEPEQNNKRKKKKTLLILAIAAAALFLIGGVAFSIWDSRHHTILLDLKTVEILEPAGSSENPYVAIRINGKARQWWFDTSSHTFHVQKHWSGDLPFTVQPSEIITTSFLKSADFAVTAFCRKDDLRYVSLGVSAADGERLNDIGYHIINDQRLFQSVAVETLPAQKS